ncbi:MAG: alpha/beta hydrolase [Caldilineae bacterium]|nr:MAG: alpha/beta hydrolase [Caldilineae bacterium]
MPFVTTSRGRFFFRQALGEEPTLIFMHGNLGTSRWWRPVLNLLPTGWRGLAYDAIGFGYSELGEQAESVERYGIAAQVQDLAAFADAITDVPFHLVAHSNATAAAVEYTLAYPKRVATLTLVGPVPASGTRTPPEAYPLLERLPGDPELLRQAIAASAPAFTPEDFDIEQLVEDARRTSPVALVASARALDAWQPGPRLRQLTLPVLLVRGERDIMLDEQEAHATLLAIPGAGNLEVLKRVGHSPMLEAPLAFANTLIRFVAEDWEAFAEVRSQE